MSRLTSDAAFNARWDNGAGWRARANDGTIAETEVARGGGADAFAHDFRALGSADQRAVVLGLDTPATRTLLERALQPRLSPAELPSSAEGRRFAAEVLGAGNPQDGVSAADLAALPVRAVPATPQEARIEQLRAALADDGRMSMSELGRFLAANPLQRPTVRAGDLVRAVAAEPQRFQGAELRVVGQAEKLSERRYSGLTYGPKFNILSGEIEFGFKTTSIMETRHRMFDRSDPATSIELHDRAEASSFFTVGWIGLGSASAAQLQGGDYAVNARVEIRDGVARLMLRDVDTRGR